MRRPRRHGWGPDEKRTVVLGVVAVASVASFVVAEVGHVWRRGSAPLPSETDNLLTAAEEAVAETVVAGRAGYQDVSVGENATFLLLTPFVTIFIFARSISDLLRRPKTL